ncbi:hypothetical protein GGX14DRAFT_618568 [Mycena pura]|uniref:Uncharacterized protein n=1 Tax=Mycena pura TaxID=153505 RepID=A0AAD6YCC1_9AGAR|nr:hypothetical protein GGX14DRAFT_618568 [Mycena pura]
MISGPEPTTLRYAKRAVGILWTYMVKSLERRLTPAPIVSALIQVRAEKQGRNSISRPNPRLSLSARYSFRWLNGQETRRQQERSAMCIVRTADGGDSTLGLRRWRVGCMFAASACVICGSSGDSSIVSMEFEYPHGSLERGARGIFSRPPPLVHPRAPCAAAAPRHPPQPARCVTTTMCVVVIPVWRAQYRGASPGLTRAERGARNCGISPTCEGLSSICRHPEVNYLAFAQIILNMCDTSTGAGEDTEEGGEGEDGVDGVRELLRAPVEDLGGRGEGAGGGEQRGHDARCAALLPPLALRAGVGAAGAGAGEDTGEGGDVRELLRAPEEDLGDAGRTQAVGSSARATLDVRRFFHLLPSAPSSGPASVAAPPLPSHLRHGHRGDDAVLHAEDIERVLEARVTLGDEVRVLHRAQHAPLQGAGDLGAHEGEHLFEGPAARLGGTDGDRKGDALGELVGAADWNGSGSQLHMVSTHTYGDEGCNHQAYYRNLRAKSLKLTKSVGVAERGDDGRKGREVFDGVMTPSKSTTYFVHLSYRSTIRVIKWIYCNAAGVTCSTFKYVTRRGKRLKHRKTGSDRIDGKSSRAELSASWCAGEQQEVSAVPPRQHDWDDRELQEEGAKNERTASRSARYSPPRGGTGLRPMIAIHGPAAWEEIRARGGGVKPCSLGGPEAQSVATVIYGRANLSLQSRGIQNWEAVNEGSSRRGLEASSSKTSHVI